MSKSLDVGEEETCVTSRPTQTSQGPWGHPGYSNALGTELASNHSSTEGKL